MRWEVEVCPECGEPAKILLEEVFVGARLYLSEPGVYEYAGESEVYWDTQEPVKDEEGCHRLECPNFHRWLTKPL
jgi:hypothetical protein